MLNFYVCTWHFYVFLTFFGMSKLGQILKPPSADILDIPMKMAKMAVKTMSKSDQIYAGFMSFYGILWHFEMSKLGRILRRPVATYSTYPSKSLNVIQKTYPKFDQICDILVILVVFAGPEKVVSGIFDLVPKSWPGLKRFVSGIFDLAPQKMTWKMTIFTNFVKNIDFCSSV